MTLKEIQVSRTRTDEDYEELPELEELELPEVNKIKRHVTRLLHYYTSELEHKEELEKEIQQLKNRIARLESEQIPAMPDEAMLLYERIKTKLERKYPNKIVAIDVEAKQVVGVGDSLKEAYKEAGKATGKTQFYFRRVGKPYLEKA